MCSVFRCMILRSAAVRAVALRRSASGAGAGTVCARNFSFSPGQDAHMNELPLPCLPWDKYYKERQQWYNMWLSIGVLWFGFSLFMLIMTGSFFLNWAPPITPAPPYEVMSSCDPVPDTRFDVRN